ncbi:hypothetical protein ACVWZP_005598 [Pseudomonas sp. TE36184]
MIHILLSLDLKNADPQQRDAFYKKLVENEFIKLRGVDTVWAYAFPRAPVQEVIDKVVRVTHLMLKEAVEDLEIQKVSYILQMGNTAPIGIVVEKVRGNYHVDEFDPTVAAD